MQGSRRHAAARHGVAVLLLGEVLWAASAFAGDRGDLVLPLMRAMALFVGTAQATQSAAEAKPFTVKGLPALPQTGLPHRRPGFIPQRFVIPDLYNVDIERTPPSFAEPIDTDRVVGFKLLRKPRWGWMPSIGYDSDGSRRVPGSRNVVRMEAEFDF